MNKTRMYNQCVPKAKTTVFASCSNEKHFYESCCLRHHTTINTCVQHFPRYTSQKRDRNLFSFERDMLF